MRSFLPGLTRKNLVRELMSGVTLVAIAVPLNIGYAQIAGLPPSAGLYALVVPTLVCVVLISSRQVVIGADAAAAALVASSLGGMAIAGAEQYAAMALAQAIICGVILVLMGVFRLGFLASFLSEPILVGFIGGLALDIMTSQFAKMLGVHVPADGAFTDKVAAIISGIGDVNGWSVLFAVGTLAVLIVGRRLSPQVPWALIALVTGTAVAVMTTASQAGVAVLGEVPGGPPALTWPMLSFREWLHLIPSALAISLVVMVEGLLVSRSYAEKNGYRANPDRDLIAFGAANLAAGATGAFAMASSTSRTAAMDQSGARTQLPSLVLAVTALLLLLFGTGLLENIPSPVIGAIVAVAVLPLLGVRRMRQIVCLDRFEFWITVVCFLGTLFIGSIPGIVIAFVLALINVARRAARPRVERTTAPTSDVVVLHPTAPLFFANAQSFGDTVRAELSDADGTVTARRLVLDCDALTDVDVTAAETFERLRDWLDANDVELTFSGVRPDVRDRFGRLGVLRADDRVYTDVADALARRP